MNKKQICERLGLEPEVLVKLEMEGAEAYAALVHSSSDPKVIIVYEENGKMRFKNPIKPIINNESITLKETQRAKDYYWNPKTELTLLNEHDKKVKVNTKERIVFVLAENASGMSMYFPGSVPAMA